MASWSISFSFRVLLGFPLFSTEYAGICEVVLTAGLFVLTTLVCAGSVHQRCTTKSEDAQVMELVHPDNKGRKVANFDHCICMYSAHVLSYELLLNILQLFTKVLATALPTAHNFSPERLNWRNRKKTKAFCNIWPQHLRKVCVHAQDEINISMGGRDKRERASRGRHYKVGRKEKKWKNYKRIMTNFHLSLKSQMRKEEIRIFKWEKKSEAPFETIEEEGVWTSNLIYEREGWTWAGLQHLIRNGADWLYPRRSSEAKTSNEGQHIPRNCVGLLALCSEIGAGSSDIQWLKHFKEMHKRARPLEGQLLSKTPDLERSASQTVMWGKSSTSPTQ